MAGRGSGATPDRTVLSKGVVLAGKWAFSRSEHTPDRRSQTPSRHQSSTSQGVRSATVAASISWVRYHTPVTLSSWREQAACAGRIDLNFFPEADLPSDEVIELCQSCPVRVECAEYVFDHEKLTRAGRSTSILRWGYWGGMSRAERYAKASHRPFKRAQRGRRQREVVPLGIRCKNGHDRWSKHADNRLYCLECGLRIKALV